MGDKNDVKEISIGIDLGTTFCCVGVYEHGRVEIIANKLGQRTTPSVVAFDENERLIGELAVQRAAINAPNTIFDTKRLIGRKFSDPTVQDDRKHWPFTVVTGPNDCPLIEVQYKGEKKSFRPEEISAMLLGQMKEIAETYLGQEVKNAVITVPAFFNDSQRQSTKDAGQIAGLNVLRIVNEPTAAAIAYGYHQKVSNTKHILVFDLGGGTFDVSMVKITSDGTNEVKATDGDTHLGGEDFDNLLVDYFVKQFQQQHHKDLSTNPRSLRRLRTACERAKRNLSSSPQVSMDIDCLYENIDFISSITIGCFEDMCHDYFQKCMDICAGVVRDSNVDKTDIDEVVLVGGSTRIPKIQSMLSDLFDGKPLIQSINADEAVAYGAAVLAATLTNADSSNDLPQLKLKDVTPLSLGVRVIDDVMSTVVPRNCTFPTSKTRNYTTTTHNQESICFRIFEGERLMTTDNNQLGEFTLQGIPPLPIGEASVDVTFDIDANGTLNVSAVEKTIGNENKITITNDAGRLSKHDIKRMIAIAEYYKSEDNINKKRAEAKFSLETYCYETNRKIHSNKIKGGITASVLKELEDAMSKGLRFSNTNPTAKADEYDKELNKLKAITKHLLQNTTDDMGNKVVG